MSSETSTTQRLTKFQFQLTAANHTLLSDAKVKDGGDDRGMDPHDLLMSSLAACTAMTVQMYADRKSWPLKEAKVSVQIIQENNQATVFERIVELIGDLDEEQKARLIDIANRCLIHRLLSGKIEINTIKK